MTPAFENLPLRVEVGGSVLELAAQQALATVAVRQRLSAPSAAELVFLDLPPQHRFVIGSRLRLTVAKSGELFDGEISGIDYEYDGELGRAVHVRAFDRLDQLRKSQQTRVVTHVDVGQFVSQIVSALGLTCEVSEPGPQRRFIGQYDQTDFDLMLDLTDDAGLYFHLANGAVRLTSLAGWGEAIDLQVGRGLARVRASTSAASMRRGVRASTWDLLHMQVHPGEALTARQRPGLPLVATSDGNSLSDRLLFNRLVDDGEGALALAQADLDRGAGRELYIEASADGNSDIRPGRIVRLMGLNDAVDGLFTVAEVVHRFTAAEGFVTDFSTRSPPGRRSAHRAPIFTFGSVTDLDDPEKLSRIRAKLEVCGDIDSDWMPVMVAGAGANKGMAVLPELEDDVLIVFPQGDLAHGIVLGGLYGACEAPGMVESGVRPFALRTRKGQAVTLDDENGIARIETSGGDVVQLGPQGAFIRVVNDLVIEAPGRSLTFRASAIDFEKV